MVGAWRFELQTSCAQGRRATRLRYAPTHLRFYSSVLNEFVAIAARSIIPAVNLKADQGGAFDIHPQSRLDLSPPQGTIKLPSTKTAHVHRLPSFSPRVVSEAVFPFIYLV
jgi:hypothetical protein